jgi:hypothetical protein
MNAPESSSFILYGGMLFHNGEAVKEGEGLQADKSVV